MKKKDIYFIAYEVDAPPFMKYVGNKICPNKNSFINAKKEIIDWWKEKHGWEIKPHTINILFFKKMKEDEVIKI